jgi:putative acetyltransferase
VRQALVRDSDFILRLYVEEEMPKTPDKPTILGLLDRLDKGDSVSIRPETRDDLDLIRTVHRLAFGGDDEARLVDALRAQDYTRVSLVADLGGRVVGHILFSDLPIVTSQGTIPSLSLAPLAVIPELQRQGIGLSLVREGLGICTKQGHRIVIVLGHPAFYPRFGFSARLAERLKAPFSGEAFMALELVPGALEGVDGEVRYPPPFEMM